MAEKKSTKKESEEKEAWMKGLKILEAEPSNAFDIYCLLKGHEDAFGAEIPKGQQLKEYSLTTLPMEIASAQHKWFVARRGKHFFGCAHAIVVPGRWGGIYLLVDLVYVVEKRRKYGIGKKLIEEIKEWAETNNINIVHFFAGSEENEKYSEKLGAKKKAAYMEVRL